MGHSQQFGYHKHQIDTLVQARTEKQQARSAPRPQPQPHAFQQLYARVSPNVARYVRRQFPQVTYEAAEDLVQQAFTQEWEYGTPICYKIANLRAQAKAMYHVIDGVVLTHLRVIRRRPAMGLRSVWHCLLPSARR